MKLSVSTNSFAKYVRQTHINYLQVCDLAKEIGYDGIEFLDLGKHYLGQIDDHPNAARAIREHCSEIGLELVSYTVDANFLAEDIEAEKARLRRCIDIAEILGVSVMRHDVCLAPRPLPRYDYTDAIAEIAPHIREVTEYAATKGIRTCSENHGRFFQYPERLVALVRAVNHDNYGLQVDVANFMSVDLDVPASVAACAPYAFHVHFKDNIFKPGIGPMPDGFRTTLQGNYLRSTIVGHGAVPVEQCLRIFKNVGYDGYLSVEFEGMEETVSALQSAQKTLRALL